MLTRTRRIACAVASQGFERLEGRRLFSTGGLDNPVVALDWNGQTTEAEAGEFILSLSGKTRLMSGRNEAGQVIALQRALRNAAGVTVEEHLGRAGQFLLDVPQDRPYEQVLASVKKLPGFEYLEPNFVFSLEATPNDPLFGYEYGLHNTGSGPLGASKIDADIDAAEAWDVTTGGAGEVVIGVVDSGIDYTHPDLAPNMWRNPFETAGDGVDNDGNGYVDDVHGINAIANNGNPMDDNSHGTHAAGTIAAAGNNGVGITGVAWNAKLMGLKFLAADGSGSTADAIECLNYATAMRHKGVNIRLTSNSWGGAGFEQALSDAIARTNTAGMLFVAAAGNGGEDGVGDNNDVYGSYPANFDVPNVVSVAATDRYDNLAGFSNFGAATVDLAAPGVDVASTVPGGYAYMSGTSMATPHVAGVAALAFAHKPSATVAEVRSALLSGVDALSNLSGKVVTGGRLNALGTLRALGNSLSGVAFDDADADGSRGGAEAALAGRTVWLDLDNDAAVDSATATLASANVPLTIPDRGSVSSTLAVSGTTGVVTDVNVTLDITHAYDSDVRAYLVSPTGRRVELVSAAGGSGDNFTGTVFDDEAATAVTSGTAPFTGSFRPTGSLADFDGASANGTWTLQVDDVALYDAGTLRSWSITLTTGEPTRTTDSAGTYKFGPLAAGAYTVRQVVPVGWTATGPVAGYHTVQVVDGQSYAGRDFGSRLPPVNPVPTAAAQLTDVTAGWGYHWFKVTYADDVAVDHTSINGTDVLVTGPNGYSQVGVLSSLRNDNGKFTATYRVAAPGGTWDAADNGTYTVAMRATEVRDTAGAYVPAGTLGSFASRIGDTVAPTASLAAAADVTTSGAGYYWFKVAYADNVAIASGVIDGNDVLVTGPNGYSQKGVLSNVTSSGATRTATYRVPAPGGSFGAEDNGTYAVTLQANQIADTSRNYAAAGVLGGFSVAVPQASSVAAAGAGAGPVFSDTPVTTRVLVREADTTGGVAVQAVV